MELFRTPVEIAQAKQPISYNSKLFLIGSCFTENIGNKLSYYKFNTLINPFGVLYNPLSIRLNLKILLQGKKFCREDLNCFSNLWFSFQHHSSFSNSDPQLCLEKINNSLDKAAAFLQKADFLLITLGTAWAYKWKANGEIVANCHKIPAKEFDRHKLDLDTIVNDYVSLFHDLRNFNSKLKIIFTVSPIRHWKDGAVNNQISKSTLILAIHKLKEAFDFLDYFPAYEIVMDDLRDYRFYAEDMIHPNTVAIDYIWNRFKQRYFNSQTMEILQRIAGIMRAKDHRPFNPESEQHRNFTRTNLKKIEELQGKYKFIDFSDEIKHFSS